MKSKINTGQIFISAAVSALICAFSLCLMLSGDDFYANADMSGYSPVFSASAENPNTQYSSDSMIFDDSIWGRLAKAIQEGLNAWQS